MQRSLVAGANALFRANEAKRPEGDRIVDDQWAHCFAERDPRVLAVRYGRFVLPPLRRSIDELQAAHCVRHRAIDELVLTAIRDQGATQVVTIGAGYDMRPTRFADLSGQEAPVRWFEVDHPATAAKKWALLEGVDGVNRDVVRIEADLATASLGDVLRNSAFDSERPTCFVLEGFIHYLTPQGLNDLLSSMAIAPRRRVIASYIRTEMYEQANSIFIRLVVAVREIPRLHFTQAALTELLAQHGLHGFETWTNREQVEAFVPSASGRKIGLSQDVASAESDANRDSHGDANGEVVA